ncbi:aspartyl/asparaginyl beta-hydroxylase domain-containing protein [Maribellus luteus]|uniref:Aspartyl/asparaginyl beta-hydroxylase domain-containing protein n=1 Tax=Maribellus luteus TaxID=2305463 RepID=A0A399SSX5_9BACT|nr:aspartyl/asparaginyl beta-hydroxylase domain-containing protein [Maribellus luteus]
MRVEKQKTIRYLKLPFCFDPGKLEKDLAIVSSAAWIQHYNTKDYSGDWSAIPLYAINGDATNIFATSFDSSGVKETAILKECLYFQEVMQAFQFEVTAVRLLRLGAGAVIQPHTDHELGYENGYFRLHVPVVTNPGVKFLLDGDRLRMLPGECWYINANFEHSVSNAGTSDRVHLVVDGIRNEWTDELFFSLAPKENYESESPVESPEMIRRMIEELQHLSEPAAEELLAGLRQKLAMLEAK